MGFEAEQEMSYSAQASFLKLFPFLLSNLNVTHVERKKGLFSWIAFKVINF